MSEHGDMITEDVRPHLARFLRELAERVERCPRDDLTATWDVELGLSDVARPGDLLRNMIHSGEMVATVKVKLYDPGLGKRPEGVAGHAVEGITEI